MRDLIRASAAVAVVFLFAPFPAHGYIDPLSGSIILQVVAAVVLGASLTVKRFWARILGIFRRPRDSGDEPRES